MEKNVIQIAILIILALSACQNKVEIAKVELLPYPNHLELKEGSFALDSKTTITTNSADAVSVLEPLADYFEENYAISSEIVVEESGKENGIHFQLDESLDLPKAGYELEINQQNIAIRSADPAGLFYATTTLLQLFSNTKDQPVLPNLTIKDFPRFDWRGMHLDVSRHFMPVSFVKKYIDLIAMYKLNMFHWHLVDGTGWRIEIKSHPELTDIGAWRVVKEGKKPWQDIEAWKEGDDRPKYGGFYTQEEIKEVIKYAEERFITIVPEIELPGHSEIVFDCYEDLVCVDHSGKPLNNIGVYCANNPDSYKLLEDVITEVIELFPSEYIHIGGDEVNKSNWEQCARCQKFMTANNYDGHQLQSHFVNHFDQFIQSKGRKLMGWNEITEGDLSPSSSIMYWYGIDGLEDILTKNHPTVVSTGTSYYFDHYQSLSEHEPQAWGGYSPLSQVYNLEPLSPEIDQNLQDLVLGIQGQIWTEYMPTPAHVEYMVLPRMLALAESAWTLSENKDWGRFSSAVSREFETFDKLGVNYSISTLRPLIEANLDSPSRRLKVAISSDIQTEILYTMDGSVPTEDNGITYDKPFFIDKNTTISAVSLKKGKVITEPEKKEFFVHKALGRQVTFINEPYASYRANGGSTLVDMQYGGRTWGSGKWIGMLNADLDVEIDLEDEVEVSKVILSCINDNSAGIYFPKDIEILISQDGESFNSVQKWERDLDEPGTVSNTRRQFALEFDPVKCKYIKVKAQYLNLENKGVFIFADEIIVL